LALLRRWRFVFDRSLAQSGAMRDLLAASGVPNVGVLGNGFAEREMRPTLSNPPLIAFAGRLSPEKGVEVLLRAFAAVRAEVPSARLLIAGDGPLAEPLRQLAVSLGVEAAVEWLGHIPRERLEARFSAAWAQAAPSQWHEPFGNVVGEAMMRGTAVVASQGGNFGEILSDGETGLLVAPHDVTAWAQALGRLLQDPSEAERLGAAGRRAALNTLGRAANLDRLLSIYHELRAARA
jgi:glycosyltransferase involved in cell wall biosynthesis